MRQKIMTDRQTLSNQNPMEQNVLERAVIVFNLIKVLGAPFLLYLIQIKIYIYRILNNKIELSLSLYLKHFTEKLLISIAIYCLLEPLAIDFCRVSKYFTRIIQKNQ